MCSQNSDTPSQNVVLKIILLYFIIFFFWDEAHNSGIIFLFPFNAGGRRYCSGQGRSTVVVDEDERVNWDK